MAPHGVHDGVWGCQDLCFLPGPAEAGVHPWLPGPLQLWAASELCRATRLLPGSLAKVATHLPPIRALSLFHLWEPREPSGWGGPGTWSGWAG